MTQRKYFKKKQRKTGLLKTVLMSISIVLVLCSIISGTVAWLITKTEPVINTFTYGDVNITLTESDTGDGDNNPNTNTYSMVPGNKITKDPLITVKKDSEDCWLFVKLEKSIDPAAFDSFMEYEVEDGWIALNGAQGVYYREVVKADDDQTFFVIKDNTVTVKDTVTKEMLNGLSEYPTLSVTAYAVQRDAKLEAIDTAAEAWSMVENE